MGAKLSRVAVPVFVVFLSFTGVSHANELRFNTGILGSYTGTNDTRLTGSLIEPIEIYSDQFGSFDSASSEDWVGGIYISAGTRVSKWSVDAYYEYRYRFDINGHIGLRPNDRLAHLRVNVNTQRLMLSLQRELVSAELWTWYAGAAAGVAFQSTELRTFDRQTDLTQDYTNTAFTYHIHSGISYALSRQTELHINIVWADLGDVQMGPQLNGIALNVDKYIGIDLQMGISYRF